MPYNTVLDSQARALIHALTSLSLSYVTMSSAMASTSQKLLCLNAHGHQPCLSPKLEACSQSSLVLCLGSSASQDTWHATLYLSGMGLYGCSVSQPLCHGSFAPSTSFGLHGQPWSPLRADALSRLSSQPATLWQLPQSYMLGLHCCMACPSLPGVPMPRQLLVANRDGGQLVVGCRIRQHSSFGCFSHQSLSVCWRGVSVDAAEAPARMPSIHVKNRRFPHPHLELSKGVNCCIMGH